MKYTCHWLPNALNVNIGEISEHEKRMFSLWQCIIAQGNGETFTYTQILFRYSTSPTVMSVENWIHQNTIRIISPRSIHNNSAIHSILSIICDTQHLRVRRLASGIALILLFVSTACPLLLKPTNNVRNVCLANQWYHVFIGVRVFCRSHVTENLICLCETVLTVGKNTCTMSFFRSW
jgi:hypothetical protein